VQQRVNALIRITLQFPLFPAVKQILAWSGLDCGECLPPRTRITVEQQRMLQARLVEAGFGELVARATRV
jgi:dihydrodipicolinate synthase/N-acetylneuraminate lyase